MSTAPLIRMPSSEVQSCLLPSQREWKVELAVSVSADRTRLHSVMTIPEYMELWMSLPGAGLDCTSAVREFPGGFRLHSSSRTSEATSIIARYKTSRRNKLIFTWNNQQFEDANESVVAIRLAGDFGRTTVHLKQLGTGSREGYRWHDLFWRQSLTRLSVLFQKVA